MSYRATPGLHIGGQAAWGLMIETVDADFWPTSGLFQIRWSCCGVPAGL